jgi:hypothetical protein
MELVNKVVTLPKINNLNDQIDDNQDNNNNNNESDQIDEKNQFKYSTIACELLTSDVPAINDALVDNKLVIDNLYSFLLTDEMPLNPLLSSYFAKVIGTLISKRTKALLEYLETRDDFSQLFLRHINTSAIMDVLLRLLTTIDNNEMKNQVFIWLKNIKIIDSMIEMFSGDISDDIHSNVSQVMCDMIRIIREQVFTNVYDSANSYDDGDDTNGINSNSNSADNEHNNDFELNPVLDTIESESIINRLLVLMFESTIDSQKNSSLVYGIDILLTILDVKSFIDTIENRTATASCLESDSHSTLPATTATATVQKKNESEKMKLIYRGRDNVTKLIINYLDKFHLVLQSFTQNNNNNKLGPVRLSIIKLINKLIETADMKVIEQLIKLGTINLIFELTFQFEWNNFLHTQLTEIITKIFCNLNSQSAPLPQPPTTTTDNFDDKQTKMEEGEPILESNSSPMLLLAHHCIHDCKIIQKLIILWSQHFIDPTTPSTTTTEQKNEIKPVGFMGHLTVITNVIYNLTKDKDNNPFSRMFHFTLDEGI